MFWKEINSFVEKGWSRRLRRVPVVAPKKVYLISF